MNRLHAAVVLAFALAACRHDGGAPDLAGGFDASTTGARDLGAAVDLADIAARIDPSGGGGSVGLLAFTAFGDIRPPLPDDALQYPSTVAAAIFDGMAAQSAQFAIGTGDYMFVEFLSSAADAQLAKLKAAENGFSAPIFHALGNHECNSLSDLNCPNLDESVNITAFLAQLVPFTKVPWYSFIIHTALGDAKFLFIAANAWSSTQAAWLEQALSASTRYTFVIRHQPTPDGGKPTSAAGIAGSDAILAGHAVTLFLYGHVHEYTHLTTNAVITGNAGAPLDAGEYGWVGISQRADATIGVTAYSMASGMPVDAWAVTPEGQAVP